MIYKVFLIAISSVLQLQTALASDTLTCKGNYNNDSLKQGVWLCRDGDRIMRKERYKRGVLQTYIVYNAKGQIVETKNRRGKVKTYKPCGC